MANRNFNRVQGLEKEVKVLFAEVAFGATGAPTLNSGLGIDSVTRNSTGNFTVALEDSYPNLMSVHIVDGYSSAVDQQWMLDQVDFTDVSSFTVQCSAAGSAADPQEGSVSLMTIFVKNSSV